MGSESAKGRPKHLQQGGEDSSELGYSFIRKGSGHIQNFMNGNLKLETLTHNTGAREIKAAVITAEPGASSEHTEIYLGEKWFYVLKGKLEMLVNDTFYELNEGDSIYLEPAAVHTWQNTSGRIAKLLVFSTPCSLSADAEAR